MYLSVMEFINFIVKNLIPNGSIKILFRNFLQLHVRDLLANTILSKERLLT